MRKIATFFSIASLLMLALACKKDKEAEEEEIIYPEIKIEVSDIDNNQATITATMTEGTFYGGKVITHMPMSEVTFNYTRELALISYVNEHGTPINEMPWTTTLEGLRADTDFLSAVIVFDKGGIPIASAYETWTAVGVPESWSDGNSAGDLENNVL